MSSPLPNALLVQRLDTLLGVSLAKYTSIARSDASFDTLLPPSKTSPVEGQTPHRQPPEKTDAAVQDGRRLRQNQPIDISSGADKPRLAQQVDNFPSSPTTLGAAARLVLSLLQSYPLPPALVLRSPMTETQVLAQLDSSPHAPSPSPVPRTGATPPGPAPTPNTAYSVASDHLAKLTNQPAQTASSNMPAASPSSGVWPGASQPAIAQLAQALALQVQTSGMFYESNLAQVAFQGASAQLLRQHPQALMPSSAAPTIRDALENAKLDSTLNLQGRADTPSTGQSHSLNSLATEHALLVRQQLEVLATQHWQAQTQAWPGVPVLWSIERMPTELPASEHDPREDNHSSGDESEPRWQTRLTLQLPHIGTVEAYLQVNGDHCQLSLYSPQSADILRQHAPALQAQFADSSVSLSSMNIYEHRTPLNQAADSKADGQQP